MIINIFLLFFSAAYSAISREAAVTPVVRVTPTLDLATEEYPPYNMSDPRTGKVVGISTEIVHELMTRAKVNYQVQIFPWIRAQNRAQQRTRTCVYSISRTPERENLYQWIGPLVFNDWVLFSKTNGMFPPKNIEEARPFVIGTYIGDAIEPYLKENKFKIDASNRDNSNPHKLLSGRIQFWATGKLMGQYILKQENVRGVTPVLTFKRTEMYLGCNKNLPIKEVEHLNRTLKQMEKEGVISMVYKKHGYLP